MRIAGPDQSQPPSASAGARAARPAAIGSPTKIPRFDLRFAAGRGLLRLAQPLSAPPVIIERLELSLGELRFPFDVTAGVRGLRTRRTTVQSGVVRANLRDLEQAAAQAGVDVTLRPDADATLHACLRDEAGPVAFTLRLIPDGVGALLHVGAMRVARDGPGNPMARIARAATRLGLVPDPSRGAFRLDRPLRGLFKAALVAHGFRLPDERACILEPPMLVDDSLRLAIRSPIVEHHAMGEADTARIMAIAEQAQLLAPVFSALVSDDLGAAIDALDGLEQRLRERRELADREPLQDSIARLRTLAELDRGDGPVSGPRDVRSADGRDPEACCARLRIAQRGGSWAAVADAAMALAAAEPIIDVAVEGLVSAVEAARAEGELGAAGDLLARALELSPTNREVAMLCVEVAEAAADGRGLMTAVRQALRTASSPSDRARIAIAGARALTRLGSSAEAERLWEKAVLAMPTHVDALEGMGRALLDRPDPAAALERFDRAALLHEQSDNSDEAARLLEWSARALLAAGHAAGAEQRLERAIEIGGNAISGDAPERILLLARLRANMGAEDAAVQAYSALFSERLPNTGALIDGLAEAAEYLLVRDQNGAARPFVERMERLAAGDSRLPSLKAASGWRGQTDPGHRDPPSPVVSGQPAPAADPRIAALDGRGQSAAKPVDPPSHGPAAIPREAAAPPAAVSAGGSGLEPSPSEGRDTGEAVLGTLDLLAGTDPGDVTRIDALVQAAIEQVGGTADLMATLVEALTQMGRLPQNLQALARLEEHAEPGMTRAQVARRLAHGLRDAGDAGAAALALVRAGIETGDAATLRAAIELAEGAKAYREAIRAVDVALRAVGDGPARVALSARRASLVARLAASPSGAVSAPSREGPATNPPGTDGIPDPDER